MEYVEQDYRLCETKNIGTMERNMNIKRKKY
jgi:hypothetical protein